MFLFFFFYFIFKFVSFNVGVSIYFHIFIYVFGGLLKGYKIFKDTKCVVPSESLTSLQSHSLLSLLIRCAVWCDSPLSQQLTLKDNCCVPAHMKLPVEQINANTKFPNIIIPLLSLYLFIFH